MKVLQVCYSGLGGHGSVANSIAKYLLKCDMDTSVIFAGVEKVAGWNKEWCIKQNIEWQYLPVIKKMSFLSWVFFFFKLVKLRPDIILLHSVRMSIPAIVYRFIFNTKLVVIEHQSNQLKSRYEIVLSFLSMRYAAGVVYLTEAYRNQMKAILGKAFEEYKVNVIPNGIDVGKFRMPEKKTKRHFQITFGMAGRFVNGKKQDVLIETLDCLRKKYPDKEFLLSFAGSGDNEANLREKAEKLGLSDLVEFAGYLSEDSLIKWYQRLQVYTHATDGETLSTSILQAMACGLPVAGTAVDGVTNLLTSGNEQYGLLVSQNTPKCWMDGICSIIENPSFELFLRENGRRFVETKYSEIAMGRKYVNLIASL